MYKFGPVQQKIILLLAGGVLLGLQTSSVRYYKLLFEIRKEWKRMDQRSMIRSIRRLSAQKLVEEKVSADGSIRLVLTTEGKRQAGYLNLFDRAIRFKKPKQWDRKWRVVIFDIPEKQRVFRDILRAHLQELGFFKLQQSVFVSPYPYEKPIGELVDLYGAKKYVRILTVQWIDNDRQLKKHFLLS